jgi:catechol 2,3-dioxygenase
MERKMAQGISEAMNDVASTTAIGVHSADHFAFAVPDLDEAARFYTDFGLEVRQSADGGLELYAWNNPHCWAKISQGGEGSSKKLRYLSFGAYEQDMPEFERRLNEAEIERCAPQNDDGGLWFRSPDGLPLQIKVAEKSSPDCKSDFSAPSAPPGRAGAAPKALAPAAKPRRLSHIAIFVADMDKALDFYADILGLRLSDRCGDHIAFVHGVHGSDHHLLALVGSTHYGLHHTSWDLPSVHDVGVSAQVMIDKGHTDGWGLGRHLLGSNYFYYVRDPWNSYSEYIADMDYVPAGHDWPAADHEPGEVFSYWGPRSPRKFAHNFEAA